MKKKTQPFMMEFGEKKKRTCYEYEGGIFYISKSKFISHLDTI